MMGNLERSTSSPGEPTSGEKSGPSSVVLELGDMSILTSLATIPQDDLHRYKQMNMFIEEMSELKKQIKNPIARKVAEYLLEEKVHDPETASPDDTVAWQVAAKLLSGGRTHFAARVTTPKTDTSGSRKR